MVASSPDSSVAIQPRGRNSPDWRRTCAPKEVSGMNATRPEKIEEATPISDSFEGEIRAFVRKDMSFWRKSLPDTNGDAAVASVDGLIQRVSGASVEEIDRMIEELQKLRGVLTTEGER